MVAKMTKQHSQRIINAQLNGKSEEEYTKEVQQNVINNIKELFFASNLSMRQFALQVGISHSSLARITENKEGNVTLNTVCKVGANLGVPIQNLFAVEDVKYTQDNEKKHYKKAKRRQADIPNQIDIFEFLQSIEKDEQNNKE